MSIEHVNILGDGDRISRRAFLNELGLAAVNEISALTMVGLSEGSFGVRPPDGKGFHPFQALGGFVDSSTLHLTGSSINLGQYGNPIPAPAPIHGASLSQLNPKLIDRAGLAADIMRAKELPTDEQIAKYVAEMRVFQVYLKDGAGYRVWDLAAPSFDPPVVTIGVDGALEVRQANQVMVSKSDGYYLRMVYHEDINRFDPKAVIGIFEQGKPPSPQEPVHAVELATPMIPSDEPWSIQREGSVMRPEDVHGVVQEGLQFIRQGKFLWRYSYENGLFSSECRAHGDRPNEEWEIMGGALFYKLEQRGLSTLLVPEPDRSQAHTLKSLGLSNHYGFATGIVLWSPSDSGTKVERKSLTNMRNSGQDVDFQGDHFTWTEPGRAPRVFRILKVQGDQPLMDPAAHDLCAVELSGQASPSDLPRSPVICSFGGFDMVKAYRRARAMGW